MTSLRHRARRTRPAPCMAGDLDALDGHADHEAAAAWSSANPPVIS